MGSISKPKLAVIQSKQADQLYRRLGLSAIGSAIVAMVLVFIIGPKANHFGISLVWLAVISLVSLYRWISARIYNRLNEREKAKHNWKFRFDIGAYLAAICLVVLSNRSSSLSGDDDTGDGRSSRWYYLNIVL